MTGINTSHMPADKVGRGDENCIDQMTEKEIAQRKLQKSWWALQKDIAQAIAPYVDSRTKPPFTAAELMVMAIVSHPDVLVTDNEILEWIVDNFLFYTRLAAVEYARNYVEVESRSRQHELWPLAMILEGAEEGFSKLLEDYDIPITSRPDFMNDDDPERMLRTVHPNAARVYLRRFLEPERQGTFRFLDLPAELRNRIYSFSLVFPEPNIHFVGNRLEFICPACAEQDWSQAHAWYCTQASPCLAAHMVGSLFRVSRQIFSEAMPVFYGLNSFEFHDLDLLCGRRAMSARQLKHVERLSVHVDWWSISSLRLVKSPLDNLSSIKDLTLIIDDADWIWDHRLESLEEMAEPKCFFKVAAAAKCLKVRTRNSKSRRSCEKFEAFIQRGIKRIESQSPGSIEEETSEFEQD